MVFHKFKIFFKKPNTLNHLPLSKAKKKTVLFLSSRRPVILGADEDHEGYGRKRCSMVSNLGYLVF